MKKGAGDDPFADEFEEESPDQERTPEDEQKNDHDIDEQTTVATPATSTEMQPSKGPEPTITPVTQSGGDLPYLARRQLKNKSVKTDRDQVPFFLRGEVQQGERDLRRGVEDELGQEVNKTDLREAAYVFAQRHPEDVAEVLREWGIEYLD